MRKTLNQNKSKQHLFGSIILIMIVVIACTTVMFVGPKSFVKADEYQTQATNDYDYYKEITISSTYVDSTLTNFPIWIHNTSSDFSSNILASGADIAFYDSTNSTRFNHEIELWNSGTGELGCWVNITSLAHDSDTTIYMYYGDSDTSDGRGYNPTSVWDGNYIGVFHMNESAGSSCNDSTAFGNDGEYNNNLPNQTTGYCGYGQQFVYDDGDWISMPAGCSSAANGTIEAWVKCDGSAGGDDNQGVVYDRPGDTDYIVLALLAANDTYYFYSKDGNVYQWRLWFDASPVANKCWYHLNAGWENGAQSFLVNASYAEGPKDGTTGYFTNGTTVGVSHTHAGQWWNGQMDEVRFSNIKRSDDWLNTSFHSTNSSLNFVTFGAQQNNVQEGASTYTIKGLPDDIITWDGTVGTSVWANETGDFNETMEINLSVNSSDNVTELRVYVGWLNDTGTDINASNISVVFSSDNTSWTGGDGSQNFSSFLDGGSNVSINSTQWTEANGFYGDSPFVYTGICDTNRSIYCRFKLAIPSGTTADTYYSFTSTYWKVYIGYYS